MQRLLFNWLILMFSCGCQYFPIEISSRFQGVSTRTFIFLADALKRYPATLHLVDNSPVGLSVNMTGSKEATWLTEQRRGPRTPVYSVIGVCWQSYVDRVHKSRAAWVYCEHAGPVSKVDNALTPRASLPSWLPGTWILPSNRGKRRTLVVVWCERARFWPAARRRVLRLYTLKQINKLLRLHVQC